MISNRFVVTLKIALHAFMIEGERHHITDLASYKRIASLFENRS